MLSPNLESPKRTVGLEIITDTFATTQSTTSQPTPIQPPLPLVRPATSSPGDLLHPFGILSFGAPLFRGERGGVARPVCGSAQHSS